MHSSVRRLVSILLLLALATPLCAQEYSLSTLTQGIDWTVQRIYEMRADLANLTFQFINILNAIRPLVPELKMEIESALGICYTILDDLEVEYAR